MTEAMHKIPACPLDARKYQAHVSSRLLNACGALTGPSCAVYGWQTVALHTLSAHHDVGHWWLTTVSNQAALGDTARGQVSSPFKLR